MSISSTASGLGCHWRRLVAAAVVGLIAVGAAAIYSSGRSTSPMVDAKTVDRSVVASQPYARKIEALMAAKAIDGPRIEFSTHRLDLGDGKPNETLRGKLLLTNRATRPLAFTVTTSCGCTKPEPASGTIEAGGTKAIQLGVGLPDYANWEKEAVVTVHSTDPSQNDCAREEGTCAVLARCPAPFVVSPAYVEFGTVTRQQFSALSTSIQVENVPGKPRVSAETLQVEHGEEGAFHVVTTTTSDGRVSLHVAPAAELPVGDHYDTADVRRAGSGYVIRVPIHVRITEPITVVPAKVFLRKDRSTGHYLPARVLVTGRGPAGPLGAVRLLDGPAGLLVEDAGGSGSTNRLLRLSFDGELDVSETVVRLVADGAARELSFELVVEP